MHILAFDPSGNFNEGKGTTGQCDMNDNRTLLHEIRAIDYESPESYWNAHTGMIDTRYSIFKEQLHVVIEGFRLYEKKAKNQIQSQFETPQLIGIIRHHCFVKGIPLKITYAVEVKNRWSETILLNLGLLTFESNNYLFDGKTTNQHKRDALKHALHYKNYGVKKDA